MKQQPHPPALFVYQKLILGFYCCLVSLTAFAQVYKEKGKNRFTFAQTTFGYDMEYTPPGGYSYSRDANGFLQKHKIGNNLSPSISITGLHFWGHAEFFTSFSLPDIKLSPDSRYGDFQRFSFTGFKIFPRALQPGKASPYAGMALSSFSYRQDEGAKFRHADGAILAGITYPFRHGLLELGANYHFSNHYSYYISTTESVPLKVPPFTFSIDYKYFFDLSVNSLERQKKGELQQEYETLKKKKMLSSFFVAAGPAYSFIVKRSSYNKASKPFLGDHRVTSLFPDIGIGYYNYRADAAANLSLRFYKSGLNAFGYSQEIRRNSVALELYKFLGDYHGFVPFAGAVLSYEKIRIKEAAAGNTTYEHTHKLLSPGLIAGWDIRPTRTDWWGVRTNIRYFPFLEAGMPGDKKISLQQFELNFLQMVLYPNRMYVHFTGSKH